MTSRWADKSWPFLRYDFPVGGHLLRIYQVGRDYECHLLGHFERSRQPAVPHRATVATVGRSIRTSE